MKKLILFATLIIGGAFSANASEGTYVYTTKPCGIQVQTVPPSVFDNEEEKNEFYRTLDEHYCKGGNEHGGGGGGRPQTGPGSPGNGSN